MNPDVLAGICYGALIDYLSENENCSDEEIKLLLETGDLTYAAGRVRWVFKSGDEPLQAFSTKAIEKLVNGLQKAESRLQGYLSLRSTKETDPQVGEDIVTIQARPSTGWIYG